jgi:hypothetical protein
MKKTKKITPGDNTSLNATQEKLNEIISIVNELSKNFDAFEKATKKQLKDLGKKKKK